MKYAIENKIAKSPLVTLDMSDYAPQKKIFIIDIKPWLQERLILIEKDFRATLKSHDWKQYQNALVAIKPVEDAIVPIWSYLLVSSYLIGIAHSVTLGDRQQLLESVWQNTIDRIDSTPFQGKPVIVKGCGESIPQSAYIRIVEKLQPIAKSIFYGEACSSVPIYKKKVPL